MPESGNPSRFSERIVAAPLGNTAGRRGGIKQAPTARRTESPLAPNTGACFSAGTNGEHGGAGSDTLIDTEVVLERLGTCRRELVASMFKMQINGPLYSATSDLLAAIDALAFVLTGNRDHFHDRPHG